MEIHVDLANRTVGLHDGAGFRSFSVRADGTGGDDEVGAVLAERGAGRPAAEAGHAWVSKAWLVATAARAPGGAPDGVAPAEWAEGFDKMLGVAAKMGWLDDDGSHIKAHIERG